MRRRAISRQARHAMRSRARAGAVRSARHDAAISFKVDAQRYGRDLHQRRSRHPRERRAKRARASTGLFREPGQFRDPNDSEQFCRAGESIGGARLARLLWARPLPMVRRSRVIRQAHQLSDVERALIAAPHALFSAARFRASRCNAFYRIEPLSVPDQRLIYFDLHLAVRHLLVAGCPPGSHAPAGLGRGDRALRSTAVPRVRPQWFVDPVSAQQFAAPVSFAWALNVPPVF